MDSKTVRQKYLDFFKARKHEKINPARIVTDDQTTLFTSSGMQQLIPYLMGEIHPSGVRLVNSQPCFRAEDIEEVGDNRHTTFFEMLGNWSLGDYFKEDQLKWIWEFLAEELGLPKGKLYVSIFKGYQGIPKDVESHKIWKSLGLSEDHIFFYGVDKNWWSRSGPPDKMPEGEIGGPDSEIFYEFTQVKHDTKFGDKCHPNCACGRFLEIGNSVFIQYQKQEDGSLKELLNKNVDFGGGLERLTAAVHNEPDIFKIDLFTPVISAIERGAKTSYSNLEHQSKIRVIADHIRAATFLILDGVVPSNKLQGYLLRRLLRRSAVKMDQFNQGTTFSFEIANFCLAAFDTYFVNNREAIEKRKRIKEVVENEIMRFHKNIMPGFKEISKASSVDGKMAFDLYQTYGFPLEVTKEIALERGQELDDSLFKEEFRKHQELSRTASAGMFKGGLAGHSETEIKYHTATHLLHQALRDVLGPEVFQKGSNINEERLRFDFSYDKKMTEQDFKKVEDLVNQKIKEDLKVDRKFMSVEEAKKINAIGLFDEKYGQEVSIYCIGPEYSLDPEAKDQRLRGGYYSVEFCGGPHVEHTGVIGKIKITKEEAISTGVRRIYAEIVV